MVRAHEWETSRRLGRAPVQRQPWWVAHPLKPDPGLQLEVETAGAHTVLFVTGDLDSATAPDLESFLETRTLSGCTVLEVDLAGVTIMASAGLGALLAVRRECDRRGIDLRLRGAQRSVARVFDLTGLSPIFRWSDLPTHPPADPDPAQDLALF